MTQESVTFLENFLVKFRRKSMIFLLFFPHIAQGWVLPGFHSVDKLVNPTYVHCV